MAATVGLFLQTVSMANTSTTQALNVPLNQIQFATLAFDSGDLFYAYSGNRHARIGILFIHGTPGHWGAFEGYLQNPSLRQRYFLVSLDRPGWGHSTLKNKKIDGRFTPQSQAVGEIFAEFPDKKWIVVGHSLGASIAPQVALDYPEQTRGLLLLAGSLKPSLGGPRWYNRAASTWVVSKLIGKSMRGSNREIMALRKQLVLLETRLKRLTLETHAIVLQGMKDRLVSPKNAAYASEAWQDNFASLDVITLDKAGHFLPWRQAPLVTDLIHQLAEKL